VILLVASLLGGRHLKMPTGKSNTSYNESLIWDIYNVNAVLSCVISFWF